MRVSRLRNLRLTVGLTLVVLVANTLAPFRTSAAGRSFLAGLSRSSAGDPVIRFRAVAPVASSCGHRAIVGVCREGPKVAATVADHHASPPPPRTAMERPRCTRSPRSGVPATRPLRC